MNDLVRAVRELRTSTGDSLQAFAVRLGLSTSAIANYEKGRVPTGKALYKLAKLAGESKRADLSEAFGRAFQKEIGSSSVDPSEEFQHGLLMAIAKNRKTAWLEEQLALLIQEARKDKLMLAYPEASDLNYVPDQKFRIEYLVGLLVDLRMQDSSAKKALEQTVKERIAVTGETYSEASLDILLSNPQLYARYKREEREAREEATALAGHDLAAPAEPEPTKQSKKGDKK